MKSNKRYLMVALALLLATLLISGLALAEDAPVKLTGIKLNKTAFEAEVTNEGVWLYAALEDESADIIFTPEPADADISEVEWRLTSSNDKISYTRPAYEYDWRHREWDFCGYDVGSTTVTVSAIDGNTGKTLAKAEATVTLKEIPITEIYFRDGYYTNPVEVNLYDWNKQNEWDRLSDLNWCIGVSPDNATYGDWTFTWTNSDPTVARVSQDGKFTPLKVGETTVKVSTTKGSKQASCEFKVKVTCSPYKSVSFSPNTFTLDSADATLYSPGYGAFNNFNIADYLIVEPNDLWDYDSLMCKKLSWSSSDKNVAKIYSTSLNPRNWTIFWGGNAGTATLTVTITNYDDTTVTGSFDVTVAVEAITSIKFIKDEYTLAPNKTLDLGEELILKPDNISTSYNGEYDLLWSSSDETVAIVANDGEVEAIKPGPATITVKCKHDESITATTKIVVKNKTVSKVKMPETLDVAYSLSTPNRLKFTYEPYDAYIEDVTWVSSDPTVIRVDYDSADAHREQYYSDVVNKIGYGYIDFYAIKAGSATLTVKVNDGETVHEASCVVTVKKESASTLKLNKKKVTLYLHKSASDNKNVEQLYAYDKNKRYGDEDVTWSSSKKSVVSVDRQGNLTVHGKGKATITATMKDGTGLTAKCTVEVKKQNLKSISGNKKITLRVGQRATLSDLYYSEMITFSPSLDKVYDDELIFKSSNRNIVSVNKKTGTLVANSVGTAEITVTSKANKKVTFTFKVKVIDAVQ